MADLPTEARFKPPYKDCESSSRAMPEWQFATIKQQKLLLDDDSGDGSSSLEGRLEYLWRDFNKHKDCSQYAALLGGDSCSPNHKQQIFVSKGNYFGQHQVEGEHTSSSSSSSNSSSGLTGDVAKLSSNSTSSTSWRTAGSQQLAALVAQQAVANCDLPPPSPETTAHTSTSPGSIKQPMTGGAELFGEALCRSQTRAREAEKLALRAFREQDELMQLFFKEASLSFAYRQWVILLQAENLCLMNMCKATWSASSKLLHSQFSHKNGRKRNLRKYRPTSDLLLRCTLAFAVGLGLAGAGLMLGWSMGWIFFTL